MTEIQEQTKKDQAKRMRLQGEMSEVMSQIASLNIEIQNASHFDTVFIKQSIEELKSLIEKH